jgi:hypothetical protein
MKRLFLMTAFALFTGALACAQSGNTMYVAIKSAPLRDSTGFFAKTLKQLAQGESVTVLRNVNNKWVQVRAGGSVTGWVSMSGLSSKRVTGAGYSASVREIALAGKGFSPETEMEYKKNGLDYSGVDSMEKITVAPNDLLKFINDGRLKKGE